MTIDFLIRKEKEIRDRILAPFLKAIPSFNPNVITYSRIVLVGILIIMKFSQCSLNAQLFIIIIAILTDLLDGTLARLFERTTKLGAFLDRLADGLLVFWMAYLAYSYKLLPLGLIAWIGIPQLLIPLLAFVMIMLNERKPEQLHLSSLRRFQLLFLMSGLILLFWGEITQKRILLTIGFALIYTEIGLILLIDFLEGYRFIKGSKRCE